MKVWRKKIPIGAIEYKIVLATPEECEHLREDDGSIHDAVTVFEEATIYINVNLAPERFAPALLHELLHAAIEGTAADQILQNVGGKKWNTNVEETFVRSLEAGLIPALSALGWKPVHRRKKDSGSS